MSDYHLYLDFATTTGYVIADGNTIIESGKIKFKPKTKLTDFSKWLDDIQSKYPLNTIVYEAVRSMANAQATISLAEMQGLVKLLCQQYNIATCCYSAPTIKKHITGYGRATKQDVVKAVTAKYLDIIIKDDNHADALAIFDLHKSQGVKDGL